jgi:hypothetical protein
MQILPGSSPIARTPSGDVLLVRRQRRRTRFCRPAPRERHARTAEPARKKKSRRWTQGIDRALMAPRRRPTGLCSGDRQTRCTLSTYPRSSTALSTIPLDSESRTARWVNASGEVEAMLIQRLRVLLLHSCRDHVVAHCPTCRRGFNPSELGSDEFIGRRFHQCGQCGTDLTASLLAHARSCRAALA